MKLKGLGSYLRASAPLYKALCVCVCEIYNKLNNHLSFSVNWLWCVSAKQNIERDLLIAVC